MGILEHDVIAMRIQEINVYTILFHQGKVLAMEMPNGLWEFAGGGIEWGESPEQAAVREAKEETGLAVSDLRFLGVTSATYDKEGNEKHSIYLVYRAETVSNRVFLSKEHINYRWLNPRELQFLKWGLNAEPVLEMLVIE